MKWSFAHQAGHQFRGKSFASSKISSRLLARVMNTHGAGWNWVEGVILLMATRNPAIVHQLRVGSCNPIIYKILHIPGGWEWDFWNINSMMSGGVKIWRLTWAVGDIICWMFSDSIRKHLCYFQGFQWGFPKRLVQNWQFLKWVHSCCVLETEPSFTQKRSWRERRDVW